MTRARWPRADPLTTERLSLEPLRRGHAREMQPVLADPSIYAYMGGSPPSEAELAARYARQARGVSPDGRQGWLNWVLRLRGDGRLAGLVQATITEDDAGWTAELAWVVASRDQGAGLATEAAGAVMAWLRTLGIESFSAHVHPANRPSAAVAGRLGLVATPVRADGEVRWSTP